MPDAVPAARLRVLADHRAVLDAVLAAADAVAADWPDSVNGQPATTDRDAVVPPLEAELAECDVLEQLPAVLRTAVSAAGDELQADPVAAPPYVVVTSTGPVLRATGEHGRLVVSLEVFQVRRDDPTVYVRAGDEPGDVLAVRRV